LKDRIFLNPPPEAWCIPPHKEEGDGERYNNCPSFKGGKTSITVWLISE